MLEHEVDIRFAARGAQVVGARAAAHDSVVCSSPALDLVESLLALRLISGCQKLVSDPRAHELIFGARLAARAGADQCDPRVMEELGGCCR